MADNPDGKTTIQETELMRMGSDPAQARRALRDFLENGSVAPGRVDDQIGRASCRERVCSTV